MQIWRYDLGCKSVLHREGFCVEHRRRAFIKRGLSPLDLGLSWLGCVVCIGETICFKMDLVGLTRGIDGGL